MEKQAFDKLKVLDLTEGIAGPYCTKLLADFGAEVIKIEKPGTGDLTRSIGKQTGDKQELESSGTYFYLNTNKKSVTLDIRSQEGLEILKELIKDSSVLVESFEPGQMAALGLTEDLLKTLNPKIIVTSISAYGQTGPYRDYKATNFTVYAAGGAMYTQRPGTRPMDRPVVEGGYQADYSTGLLS